MSSRPHNGFSLFLWFDALIEFAVVRFDILKDDFAFLEPVFHLALEVLLFFQQVLMLALLFGFHYGEAILGFVVGDFKLPQTLTRGDEFAFQFDLPPFERFEFVLSLLHFFRICELATIEQLVDLGLLAVQ